MSRRPAIFSQADIARALRAYKQVNGKAGTVELGSDGSIRIIPAEPGPDPAHAASLSQTVVDKADPFMQGLDRLKRHQEENKRRGGARQK
jgi:hypothetical protein